MKLRWKGMLVLFALAAPLALFGCSGSSGDGDKGDKVAPSDGQVTGTSPTSGTDLTEIAARVAAVLALGYNTTNPDVVMKQLSGLDPAKQPGDLFILDTREAADYATGHIPGAVNIPLQSLPQALLDGTSGIPMDKEVVVASYWGNDGNMASLLLNLYRIADPTDAGSYPKATGLFQGMTSWSYDRDLVPADTRFDDAAAAGIVVEADTETAANSGADNEYPALASFNALADTLVEKILLRARDYLNSKASTFDFHMYPSALLALLGDADPTNDPQVVSVRAGSAYAQGHIPGAINIGYQAVADLANQSKFIDPTQPAVVYCYTGHTGSLSTMALGILGYDVVNLLYGINGWTTSSAVSSGQLKNFDDGGRSWDFPLDTDLGQGVDTLAAYDPPSTGCQGCHTSFSAIWTDRVEAPPPGALAAPSSGEG